jgi:hypothetical protein
MALTLHGTVSDNTVALDRKTATPLIINGDMAIWQRGTSITSAGYTADRWEIAGSSLTASRSTDVPNDTFKYSYSFVGSSQAHVKQKIEAQNIYHVKGQDITISFYLKQTVGAGTDKVGVVLYTPTAEDNYSGVTQIASQNITTTSSWARYVVTFTNIASSVTNGLQPLLYFTSSDSQTMLFTGFQLEVGSFDTNNIADFQFEDAGTSLARCQRYCVVIGSGDASYQNIGIHGLGIGTTIVDTIQPLHPPMRTEPSMSNSGNLQASNGSSGFAATAIAITTVSNSRQSAGIRLTVGSGLSAGSSYRIEQANSSSSVVTLEAEL